MGEAVTRVDLVTAIAQELGVESAKAERALSAVTDTIQQAMAEGRRVTLVGFGSFSVAYRPERESTDPKTQRPIHIPASRSVKFRPAKALKEALNT